MTKAEQARLVPEPRDATITSLHAEDNGLRQCIQRALSISRASTS
ncbi:MAG: hypothetical protein OEQ39_23040 [Gammaproteobacteria bacterium]|nr:hypothetical protein [Gammaproteobacteria bacterium]